MTEMPIAAVPRYIETDFDSASPGSRFGMYLKLWDINYGAAGGNKTSALNAATPLSQTDRKSIIAYVQRQKAVFDSAAGEEELELTGKSVAPFTTGLGNEHPLENGFAFLDPYGLPYLPGSGVKGVVRRAAEELAHPDFFQDGAGWTLPVIWHLFGFEPWLAARQPDAEWERWIDGFAVSGEEIGTYLDSVLDTRSGNLRDRVLQAENPKRKLLQERQLHVRGALEFWDVVPRIHGEKLAVEVMTPHQSHYYQGRPREGAGSASPHDSGKPNPIPFLTVPPGSDFVFHVRCGHRRLSRCAPELVADGRWRTLIHAAFEHAFEWLGFGAKTAVGYGAMVTDRTGEHERRDRSRRMRTERQAEAAYQERLARMSPREREIEAVIRDRKEEGMPAINAVIRAVQEGRWIGAEKVEVASWIEKEMKEQRAWRDHSRKRRPEKDREYQNTLLVKDWLAGR